MTNLEDRRIQSFLTHVEQQIFTEHSADLIKEELQDHIECLIEDYKENDLSEDEAISKALLQMGDPREIGYSFTDYDAMKKRKYAMIGFKISSIIAICITLIIGLFSSSGQMAIEDITTMIPMMINFINLWIIITTGSLIMGYSMKFIDLDTTPYLILWPVKERFKWEYWSIALFFLPIVMIFFFIYFYEEGFSTLTITALWPMLTIGYGIWALFYSEKFRIPKCIVVNEGFIIKGRFISWTAISSYTWSKDFLAKKQEHYRLTLKSFQTTNNQQPMKKVLSIHKRQQAHLQAFLRERV
ncbi:MAG: hypothetical protein JEZ08_03715 [Clostridiales bacterium]|nr:hypothetical protein [Clostridiales bacterium]